MLNAISAVCEAFSASLLAVSKHIRPSSISSRVLFMFVNTLRPKEYDAEKLASTWQERREPLQVNMYKHNSKPSSKHNGKHNSTSIYRKHIMITQTASADFKENNCVDADRSLGSYSFVQRLNTMLCKLLWVTSKTIHEKTHKLICLFPAQRRICPLFSRPFLANWTTVKTKKKNVPAPSQIYHVHCFYKLENTKLANS